MQFLNLTAPALPQVVPYASIFDRALAKFIDLIVLRVCLGAVEILFGASAFDLAHGTRIEASIILPLLCLYSAWLESSKYQATVGKRLVCILVESEGGDRISFYRALLRSLTQYIWAVDYLFALFTRRKQCLHDLLAKTQVTMGML